MWPSFTLQSSVHVTIIHLPLVLSVHITVIHFTVISACDWHLLYSHQSMWPSFTYLYSHQSQRQAVEGPCDCNPHSSIVSHVPEIYSQLEQCLLYTWIFFMFMTHRLFPHFTTGWLGVKHQLTFPHFTTGWLGVKHQLTFPYFTQEYKARRGGRHRTTLYITSCIRNTESAFLHSPETFLPWCRCWHPIMLLYPHSRNWPVLPCGNYSMTHSCWHTNTCNYSMTHSCWHTHMYLLHDTQLLTHRHVTTPWYTAVDTQTHVTTLWHTAVDTQTHVTTPWHTGVDTHTHSSS